DPDRRLAWRGPPVYRRYGARLTRDWLSYHRDEDETARQSRPKIQMTGKVRGRSRVTGNLSARSRPLAPPQHHPRIAIAGDFPREAASRHLSTRHWTLARRPGRTQSPAVASGSLNLVYPTRFVHLLR